MEIKELSYEAGNINTADTQQGLQLQELHQQFA
jgi:hypothetical protein